MINEKEILNNRKRTQYIAAEYGISCSLVYSIKNMADNGNPSGFRKKKKCDGGKWYGEIIWLFERGGDNTDKTIAKTLHLKEKTVSAAIRKYLAEKIYKLTK